MYSFRTRTPIKRKYVEFELKVDVSTKKLLSFMVLVEELEKNLNGLLYLTDYSGYECRQTFHPLCETSNSRPNLKDYIAMSALEKLANQIFSS